MLPLPRMRAPSPAELAAVLPEQRENALGFRVDGRNRGWYGGRVEAQCARTALDPEQPSNSRDHALQKLQCRHVFSEPDVNLAVTIARQLGFSIESRHRPNAIFSWHANPEQKTKARDGNENNACA